MGLLDSIFGSSIPVTTGVICPPSFPFGGLGGNGGSSSSSSSSSSGKIIDVPLIRRHLSDTGKKYATITTIGYDNVKIVSMDSYGRAEHETIYGDSVDPDLFVGQKIER